MESCPGGGSRFGALSVVLSDMGFSWQMYTPPYVILLIRTFLTLEGIAAQVDNEFNIYEVALPWAVERALSPSTASGAKTLRSSLLTDDNRFQWERIEAILEQEAAQAAQAAQAVAEAAAAQPDGSVVSERARLMSALAFASAEEPDPAVTSAGAAAQAAQATTPLDSLRTVLGSSRGAQLRRIALDLDSTELMLKLVSREARPVRRLAVDKLTEALSASLVTYSSKLRGRAPRLVGAGSKGGGAARDREKLAAGGGTAPAEAPDVGSKARTEVEVATPWPKSEQSRRLKARLDARARSAGSLLLRAHVERQILAGWRGAAAVGALTFVVARVILAAVARTVLRHSGRALSRILPAPALAAFAAGAAMLALVLGRGTAGIRQEPEKAPDAA
jgi:hypothetical protein